jgi:hypothetical protein
MRPPSARIPEAVRPSLTCRPQGLACTTFCFGSLGRPVSLGTPVNPVGHQLPGTAFCLRSPSPISQPVGWVVAVKAESDAGASLDGRRTADYAYHERRRPQSEGTSAVGESGLPGSLSGGTVESADQSLAALAGCWNGAGQRRRCLSGCRNGAGQRPAMSPQAAGTVRVSAGGASQAAESIVATWFNWGCRLGP